MSSAGNLIDGDVNTTWQHWATENHWIILDLGNTYKVSNFRLYHVRFSSRAPSNITGVYVSSDAVNWGASLGSLSVVNSDSTGWKEVGSIAGVTGRYVKLTSAADNSPYWREFQAYVQTCHKSDLDCSGCVSSTELTAFIGQWYLDSSNPTLRELMEAIGLWKRGGC
jgi:hypothetical protein